MNYEEFIRPTEPVNEDIRPEKTVEATPEAEIVEPSVELDVQKAVVQELAAEKVEQNECIVKLEAEVKSLKSKITELNNELLQKTETLVKVGDALAKDKYSESSNSIALLDRNVELDDKFEGETRDHVLEAIKAAYAQAEADGRIRCAKILESVMLANVPSGNLAEKRAALEKVFKDNANLVSGPVIDELNKLNIPYKNGEEYLLPSEIIKRNY